MSQGAIRLTVPRSNGFVSPEDTGRYLEYFSGHRRVLYTPSSADSLYNALVADTGDVAATPVPVDVDAWTQSFPHLKKLIASLENVPARWDTFEFIKLKAWSVGKVAVIGDAAHAQPPYLGQGGGCAMRNALGLADALTVSTGSVPEALQAWEAGERPTIQHTQRWSYGLRLLNNIPDGARSHFLSATGCFERLGRSRLRAALTTPARFGRFAGTVTPDRKAGR